MHGVRKVDELGLRRPTSRTSCRSTSYLGEQVREQLVYYPTVTREPFRNQGRLTDLIASGKLCSDIGFRSSIPSRTAR